MMSQPQQHELVPHVQQQQLQVSPSGRFFTTNNNVPVTTNATSSILAPNILITNNYAQQQQQRSATLNSYNPNNLRILSTQQQIFGLGKDHQLQVGETLLPISQQHQQQLYHQQLQQHFAQQHPHLASVIPPNAAQLTQHYITAGLPHYSSSALQPQHSMPLHLPPVTQHYYVPNETAVNTAAPINTAKLMPVSTLPVSATESSTTNGSTVVLDRINICINNHYSDVGVNSPMAPHSLTATMSTQQPSPIIPAIQHKPTIVDIDDLIIDHYPISGNESPNLVIDEPDSTTTTPHTPPTTPENVSPSLLSPSFCHSQEETQSPSSTAPALITTPTKTNKQNDIDIIEEQNEEEISNNSSQFPTQSQQNTPLTPSTNITSLTTLTPIKSPTPSKPNIVPPLSVFSIGEDVFIKRKDDRLYLGTIIDAVRQQFLVRFDDKSECLCKDIEMQKFGGLNATNKSEGSKNVQTQMCVSCKRTKENDIVEICDRCARGYHRNCTTETLPGSGVWLCKRCVKPMKMLNTTIYNNNNVNEEAKKKPSVCRQLPYHVESLNWDEKHRVNEEQIYCYCGKSGKFDQNMLQCCKCRNWFHTLCMQSFNSTILRGDGFFVFGCTVCNDGDEFLRRLQMTWVDLIHLTLYNLSAMRKHQHQKYHHLTKDILPFLLAKRATLPIPIEWIQMPDDEFAEHIKSTLKENTDRFLCGNENKRDQSNYALRNNGPPILPSMSLNQTDVLSDALVTQKLKLKLLKDAPENNFTSIRESSQNTSILKLDSAKKTAKADDIYEFRIEEDEKFTSDDEIPIKEIIEKVKKQYKDTPKPTVLMENLQISEENCNKDKDSKNSTTALTHKKSPQKFEMSKNQITTKKSPQKLEFKSNAISTSARPMLENSSRSRTRKTFTISKSYRDRALEAADMNSINRICDSSSDTNSSSSRATSLDLIIPPPKNFLGRNNPFHMASPKKSAVCSTVAKSNFVRGVGGGGGGTMIKCSTFNTTPLDFSNKLTALKNSGIYSNLSTSNLAKAAGQPRTVRTIKRRLNAKDITIGPNQEIRRRRTRPLASNVEVISTTTINPIPSNFIPIYAKDLHAPSSSTTTSTNNNTQTKLNQSAAHRLRAIPSPISSSSSPPASTASSLDSMPAATTKAMTKPTHGRRLRERPQKNIPNTSRRDSISSASTTSNQSISSAVPLLTAANNRTEDITMHDLKQSVNKYFGAVNRIQSGEKFAIRAKRQLSNGQSQYLLEWGE